MYEIVSPTGESSESRRRTPATGWDIDAWDEMEWDGVTSYNLWSRRVRERERERPREHRNSEEFPLIFDNKPIQLKESQKVLPWYICFL